PPLDMDNVAEAPVSAGVPAQPRREPEVNKLFRAVMKHQGSDLHLKVGQPPMMRLKGIIQRMNAPPLTQEQMERLLLPVINEREPLHILTIEDPIEFTFTDKKSVVNQREIGLDVMDWHKALKDAVRQDPDIILVGELRDRDTFEAGIHAAETGHLVFGTI